MGTNSKKIDVIPIPTSKSALPDYHLPPLFCHYAELSQSLIRLSIRVSVEFDSNTFGLKLVPR